MDSGNSHQVHFSRVTIITLCLYVHYQVLHVLFFYGKLRFGLTSVNPWYCFKPRVVRKAAMMPNDETVAKRLVK